jgi:Mce-associated membrane protein
MSTQQPGGPRRRRIAGERRSLRDEQLASPVAPAPAGDETFRDEPDRSGAPETSAASVRTAAPPAPALARDPAADPAGRTGWWGSTASIATLAATLAVLLGLLACIALGAGPFTGFTEVGRQDEVERAGERAAAAAESSATEILAYNHKRMDADREAATAYMTPAFAEKYTETFTKVVVPAAEQTRARVTSEVRGSAVVRASQDTVRVLLFVDQTTVSTANETPQSALNRVELVMVERSGAWLVDDITSY